MVTAVFFVSPISSYGHASGAQNKKRTRRHASSIQRFLSMQTIFFHFFSDFVLTRKKALHKVLIVIEIILSGYTIQRCDFMRIIVIIEIGNLPISIIIVFYAKAQTPSPDCEKEGTHFYRKQFYRRVDGTNINMRRTSYKRSYTILLTSSRFHFDCLFDARFLLCCPHSIVNRKLAISVFLYALLIFFFFSHFPLSLFSSVWPYRPFNSVLGDCEHHSNGVVSFVFRYFQSLR